MAHRASKAERCSKRKTVPNTVKKFVFPPGVPYEAICRPAKTVAGDFYHQYFLTQHHYQFGHEDAKLQLIRNFVPVHYTICLKPDLEALVFEGCVAIQCELTAEVESITLNCAGLATTKIVWTEDDTFIEHYPTDMTPIPTDQRLNIMFEPALPAKPGNLLINFKGFLKELRSNGFYASKYTNEFGKQHFNPMTKFLPAQARKCFPCFDEPSFKATFRLSFILPKTMTVVSNMATKVSFPHRTDKDLHVIEFDSTPKMSTALLAFAIGHFNYIEEFVHVDIPCRIYANVPPRRLPGKHIFETVHNLITFFTEYLMIPFPMRKFDILVEKITRSSIVASENWGLVIINEGDIMEVDSDSVTHWSVVTMLAHVIFKQWFGNFVTPKWWTHLWLYESLARLMEYVSLSVMEPEDDDVWMRFVAEHNVKALEMDALTSTHIIEVPIRQPSELKEVLDSMAYSKGAAVLRMIKDYIGQHKFRQALNAFLKKYAYGNATTEEFCAVLERVTEKPITSMMLSWTKQLGFPLVRVSSARYENNSRVITMHQHVFCSDSSSITGKPNALWIIPVSISISSNPYDVAKDVLLDKRSISFRLPKIAQGEWFKLNPGLTGFYRVKYPVEMFSMFRQAIRVKSMPPLDRLGMLSDTFALAESGMSSSIEVFGLLEAFEDEDNLPIWMYVDEVVHDLDLVLHTDVCYANYKNYIKAVYKNAYERVGWNAPDDESNRDKLIRKIVISRLLICGHEGCLQQGQQRFESLMLGEEFPPQVVPMIYKAGLTFGDHATFQSVIRRFRSISDWKDRADILESLGFCRNEVVLRDVLEFSLSDHVHQEDTILVFKSLASNALGRNILWEFFKERYAILGHRYPPGSESLSQLLQAVIECYNTEEKLIEISDFFKTHQSFPGCERIISQSLEKIHNASAWLKRDRIGMSEYLTQYEG